MSFESPAASGFLNDKEPTNLPTSIPLILPPPPPQAVFSQQQNGDDDDRPPAGEEHKAAVHYADTFGGGSRRRESSSAENSAGLLGGAELGPTEGNYADGNGGDEEDLGIDFELDSMGSNDELVMPLAPNESIQRPISAATASYVMWRRVFINLVYIVLWYTFSTCLSLYNKWMMGTGEGQRHFKYPFFLTTMHFVAQFAFSALVIYCFPSLRPKVKITWRDYFLRVVPSGIATSLDIGLSNLSFKFITLTFYTMCKSSSPVFLLIFAFLFKLEKFSFWLVGIVAFITLGIILAVMGEASFDATGFVIIMCASVLAGLRWTITQMLLQKEKLGMTNPFATLYYIAPVMAFSLFIISLPTERIWEIPSSPAFATSDLAVELILLIAAGAVLAFFMVVAEFQLIRETSAVTFMIAGIVKEVLVIIVAVIIFGDVLVPVNIVGLIFVILGVSLYNLFKYRKVKQAMAEAQRFAAIPPDQLEDGVEFLSMKNLKEHNAALNGH